MQVIVIPFLPLECLNELGDLISKFGMDICKPTQAKAMEIIAKQIGSRDNGVRSAALNAIVEAYNTVGNQVFNLIGEVRAIQGCSIEDPL